MSCSLGLACSAYSLTHVVVSLNRRGPYRPQNTIVFCRKTPQNCTQVRSKAFGVLTRWQQMDPLSIACMDGTGGKQRAMYRQYGGKLHTSKFCSNYCYLYQHDYGNYYPSQHHRANLKTARRTRFLVLTSSVNTTLPHHHCW